jgi:hypothetical protein
VKKRKFLTLSGLELRTLGRLARSLTQYLHKFEWFRKDKKQDYNKTDERTVHDRKRHPT